MRSMVTFRKGNLFDSKAEALVNTVNCVGIMGKGIAYQFKRAFPEMNKDYVRLCREGKVRLGEVTSYEERGKLVVNFPTKNHWRSASDLKDIRTGLKALRNLIVAKQIRSIAIPPLGCGNGGLDWTDVREAISNELADLEQVDVEVYVPAVEFESKVANEPKLSLGHFVLVALRSELKKPTKLNIQKAAYFFNVFWGETYFRFTDHRFGPYSLALEPMFATIRDYMSFTGIEAPKLVQLGVTTKLRGGDAETFARMLSAVHAVADYCNSHLTRLELLATTHAIVGRESESGEEELVDKFLKWSPEKSQKFAPNDVKGALRELEGEGLIRRTLLGYAPVQPAYPGARTVRTLGSVKSA